MIEYFEFRSHLNLATLSGLETSHPVPQAASRHATVIKTVLTATHHVVAEPSGEVASCKHDGNVMSGY